MKNINQLTKGRIKGIFSDIDDTISFDGKLLPEAFSALWELKKAGFIVIPITGRPAGWCDHIARFWPVDGVVGENGAFYFRSTNDGFIRRFIFDENQRALNKIKLNEMAKSAFTKWPFMKFASDQAYRECDLAIDYREDVSELKPETVDEMMKFFENYGAVAKLSSIHINTWFGDYDKLGACKLIMQECFNIDLDTHKDEFIYSGDSPNDEPMFEYFPISVGVANLQKFVPKMKFLPSFITEREGSYGFAEMAERLLCSRKGQ